MSYIAYSNYEPSCFEQYVDFHNEGVSQLAASCVFVSKLEIDLDEDGCLSKIMKIFLLVIGAIPLSIVHFFYTLFSKIISCCTKSKQVVDEEKAARRNLRTVEQRTRTDRYPIRPLSLDLVLDDPSGSQIDDPSDSCTVRITSYQSSLNSLSESDSLLDF